MDGLGMTQLTAQLDLFESRLRKLEAELAELRRLARAEDAGPAPEPEPLWAMIAPEPEPVALAPKLPPPLPPREPFDYSVLFGARSLAWTGGVVTLLGIVFLFVLAAERGWIGPEARVAIGTLASGLALAAAVWLRRRFGETYASVSAAGAGIAGLYATLLAATALYDLLSPSAAILPAALIAALGAAIALAWSSETIASLGLVGAMLVPVPVALQDELSSVGAGFAAIVLAATCVVAVRRDWRALLVAGLVATVPQGLALAAGHRPHATLVVTGLWLVYAAAPTALALSTRLTYLPASLLLVSGAFGGLSAGILFDDHPRGWALLVVAATYGAGSILLWRRDRDTASLHWAIALALGALSLASLVSDATLTIGWAAEAAVLAWLAHRIDEPRFKVAAYAWLGLALGHALAIDELYESLFVQSTDAWHDIPTAAALAAASFAVGVRAFRWEPLEARAGVLSLSAASAIYGVSLGVVSLPASWSWGHVGVAVLWGGVAVSLASTRFRFSGAAMAAAATMLVLFYDVTQLESPARWWSVALTAVATLAVGVIRQLRSSVELDLVALAASGVSAGLAFGAADGLLDGKPQAVALLGVAVAYSLVAAALRQRRLDFACVVAAISLAFALLGSAELLDGTWLVLAWAGASAALSLLAVHERRLIYGAATFALVALAHTLAQEAQPRDLFVSQSHPGAGAPAVLFTLVALSLIAWREARRLPELVWACGGVALYAITLVILEVSEDLGGGIDTAFQRGHTAVSTVWGIVGLSLLYLGLRRAGRMLRIGGLALFGLSLAKLLLYDLTSLSSVARAFSFIAVGGLFLVGGFFYQRMDVHSPT
jgi:Predicted membrane protein (DUF2339)